MPARDTSKDSYKQLTDLGNKQRDVYDALKTLGYATDREITNHLEWTIDRVLPRRGELVEYGFIVKHGEKWNPITKRNVTVWTTNDPMAQRAVEKVAGKSTHTEERKSVNKFSLRLRSGKQFIISGEMRDEIMEAIAAKKTGSQTITIANQVFTLSNIALPMVELTGGAPAGPIEKEDTRELLLVIKDGLWIETNESERVLRKARTIFRTRKVGVKSGAIHSDLMTTYDGIYESVKDMRGIE
jgi:hypothetical protein